MTKAGLVVLSLVAVVIVVAFVTPVAGNLWGLLTGVGYVIPHESSIFTFHVTQDSGGSAEWWAYGEDSRIFYGAAETEGTSYVVFPRAKVSECPAFAPRDSRTWCAPFKTAVK